MDRASFSDIAIVSCGTLTLELNHLKEAGSLDAGQILYTTRVYTTTPASWIGSEACSWSRRFRPEAFRAFSISLWVGKRSWKKR